MNHNRSLAARLVLGLLAVNALLVTAASFAADGNAPTPPGGEGYGLRACALPGLVEAAGRSRACIYACTDGNRDPLGRCQGQVGPGLLVQ